MPPSKKSKVSAAAASSSAASTAAIASHLQPTKAASAALPSTFSRDQAKKAVDALLAHHTKVTAEKEVEDLLPTEERVWLVVNTQHGSTKKSLMPVRIQLPHPPLPPPPTTSICLISKDPQREYKDLIAAHKIKFISRVVGVEKLKGKFKPFEPRRQLLRDHELFLCDDRVVRMMPKLLGKMFFDAKKQPIPVNLLRKDLKAELGRAIASTYFHPTTGTSSSIRIATPSSTTSSQTLDNLLSAVPLVIAQIQGEWDNVLSIGIKTSSSVLLPIWSNSLNGRFESSKPAAKEGAEKKDVEMEVEQPQSEEEEHVTKPAAATAKPETKTKTKTKAVAGKPEKVEKKKSSTIGSGAASKKSKQGAVGKVKAK